MSLPPLKYQIRPAQKEELDILVNFQEIMCIETEQRKLQHELIYHGIRRALENPEAVGAQLYVAEIETPATTTSCDDDKTDSTSCKKSGEVGAMMMTTTEFDLLKGGQIIWFQSVYVMPQYRRRGIFKQFFSFVKNLAESSENAVSLRLDVDKLNINAQRTYDSLGMRREEFSTFRWTAPGRGLLPLPLDKNKEEQHQEQEQEQQPVEPESTLEEEMNKKFPISFSDPRFSSSSEIKLRLATLKDIPALVKIYQFSSKKYYSSSFSTEKENVTDDEEQLLRKSMEFAIQAKAKNEILDELIVVELSSSSSTSSENENIIIIGSALLSCEHSDWRDALVINFQHFSVAEEFKSLRSDIFRFIFRNQHKRVLQSLVTPPPPSSTSDVSASSASASSSSSKQKQQQEEKTSTTTTTALSGIRFVLVVSIEEKLNDCVGERVDGKVALEEGFLYERYYWMRYDKKR